MIDGLTRSSSHRTFGRALVRAAAALLLLCGLSSCGVPLSQSAFNDTPEAKALQNLVAQLAARDYAAIEAQLDAGAATPASTRDALVKMSQLLPVDAPSSITPATWKVFVSNGARRSTVAAEYDYPTRHIYASAVLDGDAGHFKVAGFHLEPLLAPLAERNAFTFAGKSALHYIFLASMFLAIGISILALVQCVRTKGLRRKWLWLVFISFGVCGFTLDWTTGALEVKLLTIDVLSAAYARSGWLGPWLLTACVPLGAIIFLLKRTREQRAIEAGGVVQSRPTAPRISL